jgi:hypothetical protein
MVGAATLVGLRRHDDDIIDAKILDGVNGNIK